MKITDKVKTYEDAAKLLELDPALLPDVSMLPEDEREALIANYKLWVIAKALNEGWKPDWSNYNEYKYYPYFYYTADKGGAGVGFASDDCAYVSTDSGVGSRLCFKSQELAEYAGKQFVGLYETLFVLK